MSTDLQTVIADINQALSTVADLNVTTFDPNPSMALGAAAMVGLPLTWQRIDFDDTVTVELPIWILLSASSFDRAIAQFNTYAPAVIDCLRDGLDARYMFSEASQFGLTNTTDSNVFTFQVTVTFTG